MKLLHIETDSKCRLCIFDETIDHIISAYPILAKQQYIKRHNRVCAQLQFNICKESVVKLDKKHCYKHVPKSAETSQEGKINILWNPHMQTNRTIPSNKPDITTRDNEKGTCMLILVDVAISGDRNEIKKEVKKILKYNRNTAHVECKNKCDTSNNMSNWNYLKIIQKIPVQHTRKA
jgi:hypothetical protein